MGCSRPVLSARHLFSLSVSHEILKKKNPLCLYFKRSMINIINLSTPSHTHMFLFLSLSIVLHPLFSHSLFLPLSLSLSLVAAAVSISSWQKGTLWINDTELLKVQILNNEFHHQKHNNFSNHKIALPFHIDCACATRCTESTVCIRAR